MAFKLKTNGLSVKGVKGDAIYVRGHSDVEFDLSHTTITEIGGNAINVESPEGVMETLGLPPDTNPKELAEFLLELRKEPEDTKEAVANDSNFFDKYINGTALASGIVANLLNISRDPQVGSFIAVLMTLAKSSF